MSDQQKEWIGKSFGLWTVVGSSISSAKGERKWLCRCACGTERYVLERSLKSGGSKSCGCQTRLKSKDAVEHKLEGKTFGDLTVLKRAAKRQNGNGTLWLCECSCGNRCEVLATLLVKGRKTHCGCKTQKIYTYRDIRGKKFNRLTAIEPIGMRDYKGGVVWLCRCECGNEVEVSYNNLAYSDVQSCGCQKKEHDQKLPQLVAHVDGTSIDAIKSAKIPSSNTTGVRGVYYIKGKYLAKIVFQKKQYHLGSYDTIEEAAQVRKEAEDSLFAPVVEHYERWKAKADVDPEWGEANPFKITVAKETDNTFSVECLPKMGNPESEADWN